MPRIDGLHKAGLDRMPFSEPSLTIGVEEEYLIVDPVTRDLAEPPDEAFNKCGERLKNLVKPEFMKSQIEVATRVCGTIKEIRNELIELRSVIAEVTAPCSFIDRLR